MKIENEGKAENVLREREREMKNVTIKAMVSYTEVTERFKIRGKESDRR